MVKGISHVNKVVANFDMGLVYRGTACDYTWINYQGNQFSRFYGFFMSALAIIIAFNHGSISCYVDNLSEILTDMLTLII